MAFEWCPKEIEIIINGYKFEMEKYVRRAEACRNLLSLVCRFNPEMAMLCSDVTRQLKKEPLTDDLIDRVNGLVNKTVGFCTHQFTHSDFSMSLSRVENILVSFLDRASYA